MDNFVTIKHRLVFDIFSVKNCTFMTSSLTSQVLDQLYPRGPYKVIHVGGSVSRYLKLLGREIIFELFQPV